MAALDWGIKYCLAQNIPEQCRLNFSAQITTIVIATNVLKLVTFYFALMASRHSANDHRECNRWELATCAALIAVIVII
jgi:hypothetical protein